jgi:hypothetical protein
MDIGVVYMVCDLVILLNDLFIYNFVYPHISNKLGKCFKLSLKALQAGYDLLLALLIR